MMVLLSLWLVLTVICVCYVVDIVVTRVVYINVRNVDIVGVVGCIVDVVRCYCWCFRCVIDVRVVIDGRVGVCWCTYVLTGGDVVCCCVGTCYVCVVVSLV